MTQPPQYSDLSKHAKDVLNKDYNFGLHKIVFSSKQNSVNYTSMLTRYTDNNRMSCSLDVQKTLCNDIGSFTGKVNTDKTFGGELVLNKGFFKQAPGLQLTVDGTYLRPVRRVNGKVRANYTADRINLTGDYDYRSSLVQTSGLFGHLSFLGGYHFAYDVNKEALKDAHFAVGYKVNHVTIHGSVNNGQMIEGSLYYKISKDLEAAVQIGWTNDIISTPCTIGCKYQLCEDSSVGVKINESMHLGLSYSQKVMEWLTIALSAKIDFMKLNQGGHRLGFSLNFKTP